MNRRYIDFVPVKPQAPKRPARPVAEEPIAPAEDFVEEPGPILALVDTEPADEPAAPTITTVRTSVTEETTVFLPDSKPSAPQPHFINAEKVVKRPLSPNAPKRPAPAQPATPVNEPAKSPVTIIDKPKKESHAKTVITIILTIILGAAAGVVAFLLLPK